MPSFITQPSKVAGETEEMPLEKAQRLIFGICITHQMTDAKVVIMEIKS